MKIGETEAPEPLLAALRRGELVVFAGAGVSMGSPACLPNFKRLAERVAEHSGLESGTNEPVDAFLGRLKDADVDVHGRAVRKLSARRSRRPKCGRQKPAPTDLHRNLLRLYRSVGEVRLVTTNFDRLFEWAVPDVFGTMPEVFRAPALPLGNNFGGIVHVHGSVQVPGQMVLTDADSGRAYLTEGWARRFIVDLFQDLTVLFVGYSHEDVVLKYLARALPPAVQNRRFALVGSRAPGSSQWQNLGVDLVPFPQASDRDYSALAPVVRALADWARQDVFERRAEIREMAADSPPLDDERSERLVYALAEPENVRFFTESAESPKWIEWLEERGFLDGLFDDSRYSEPGHLFEHWLLRRFGADRASSLFALLARHGNAIAPRFWFSASRMVWDEEVGLNDETLSQWASLLLDSAPRNGHVNTDLVELGVRCAKQGRFREVLGVFEAFLAPNLCSVQAVQWRNQGGAGAGEQYRFERLWKQGIVPSLPEIAEPLLASAVALLERRQHLVEVWRPEDGGRDVELIFRYSVEPGEEGFPRERGFVDMALDAARDSLEWLARHDEQILESWCARMIRSTSTALRRLAVHGLSLQLGTPAGGRIDWLLNKTDLHELSLRPEVFRVAREAFPVAGDERRPAFVDRIVRFGGRSPGQEDAARTAYQKFNWLVWLEDVVPDCPFLKSALDPIRESHPEFGRRDRPDLVVAPGEAYVVERRSRWSAEQLLKQEPEEWVSSLPADLPEDEMGPGGRSVDRAGGLADEIEKAVERDSRWGLAVARALLGAGRLEEPFWPALVRSLGAAHGEVVGDVLTFFRQPEVQARYGREIAEVLSSAVKDGKSPWTGDLFASVLELGADLSEAARSDGTVDYHNRGWVERALNHSAEPLAMLWIRSLKLLRQKDRAVVGDSAYCRVRSALSRIVDDTTDFGAASVSILPLYLRFLLAVEEEWTREKLLPLFGAEAAESEKAALHEAAWDGFLSFLGRPEPVVPKAMMPVLLDATASLGRFTGRKREEFIRCASWIMVHFSADHLTQWVPRLFENTDEDGRILFAKAIEFHLLQASPDVQSECWRRWLRRYWLNRIEGVPAPLTAEETAAMFDWLPRLPAVLDEAVRVAVRMRMPKAELPRVSVRGIRDTLPVADHPAPLARLALRLDEFQLSPRDDYELDKLFADLLEAELPEETRRWLTEVAVRRGVVK